MTPLPSPMLMVEFSHAEPRFSLRASEHGTTATVRGITQRQIKLFVFSDGGMQSENGRNSGWGRVLNTACVIALAGHSTRILP